MNSVYKLSFYLLILGLFSGCSINDSGDKRIKDFSIVGTWQLVESYVDPGDGSGNWQPVEAGFQYTFFSDGSFISNKFTECTKGNYVVEGNKLILDFNCEGFTTGIEDPEGVFVEEITYKPGYMFLDPVYIKCTEGCGFKYKKIGTSE